MDETSEIPTRSGVFWIVLLSLFALVMALTMWKDWWLTGEAPNILFYVFVPATSMLAGVLCMAGVARLSRQGPAFLEMLAIIVAVNTVMQVMEIVLKLTYYLVWEYPGWLYLVIVFPLGLVLGVVGLVRWGRAKWGQGAILALVELGGELVAAALLTSVGGLTTPGS